MKPVYQYIAIFFNFSLTSNYLHPLQVENCDSNSRLEMDEDDNGKFRIKRVKPKYICPGKGILSWPVSRECLQHEPDRIEYYNQLICLCGHHWGVSKIQTSLDVSEL